MSWPVRSRPAPATRTPPRALTVFSSCCSIFCAAWRRDKWRDKWHGPGVSRISPHPRLRRPVHTSRTAICAARRISPLGSHTHSVCVRLSERRQGIRPGRRLQKYEQAVGWTCGQPQRHLRHRHRRQRHRRRRKTDGSRTAICATKRISPLGSHTHSVCVRLGERRQGIRPGRRLQKYEQAVGWTCGQPPIWHHLRHRSTFASWPRPSAHPKRSRPPRS